MEEWWSLSCLVASFDRHKFNWAKSFYSILPFNANARESLLKRPPVIADNSFKLISVLANGCLRYFRLILIEFIITTFKVVLWACLPVCIVLIQNFWRQNFFFEVIRFKVFIENFSPLQVDWFGWWLDYKLFIENNRFSIGQVASFR